MMNMHDQKLSEDIQNATRVWESSGVITKQNKHLS